MNRSDIGRVHQQATRTAMPGTTRQSNLTAPLGTRGTQYRAAEMQRGAPTQRGAADPKDDEDEDGDGLPDRAQGDGKDEDKEGTDDENDDDKPDDDQKNKKAKS